MRRYAVARSLFEPTTLSRALEKFSFVQADPIRAPARAQDLTLRHRVKDYCAGDLERRHAKLDVEEDFFINYGFVTKELQSLMHPRIAAIAKPAEQYQNVWHSPRGRRRRKRAQRTCSSSSASAARCIRARSILISRTVR